MLSSTHFGFWRKREIAIPTTLRTAILEPTTKQSPSAEVIVKLIHAHYRLNDLETCTSLITDHGPAITGYNEISFLPELELAYQRDHERFESLRRLAVQRAKSRDGSFASLGSFGDWQLLGLLGEHELAKERAQDFLRFCKANQTALPVAKQLIPVAERMAGVGNRSDEQILAGLDIEEARVNATCWLAIDHLHRGEREAAMELFERTTQYSRFRMWSYRWAELFHERITSQEDWLPWIIRSSA